jgi:3',5'-cyclic AMP phosphodiesterase CpdA
MKTLLLCGLLLARSILFAHETTGAHDHAVAPYPAKEYHRPTPMPDRVVLTWSGDPATTQAITWRTDTSVTRAIAQLALATDKAQTATGEDRPAITTVFESDLGAAHYHAVELRDLTPDTLYAYRVGDGVNWSEWQHFRTGKREAAPFTFVYFGDAQNDIRTHWSRVFREAFRAAPRAAFTLHAGDLINRAQRDAEWGEWFGAPGWVNGTVPIVPTPGNHEYWNRGAGPEHKRHWTTKAGETLAVTAELKTERDAAGKVLGYRIEATSVDGRSASATLDAKEHFASVDIGFTALTGYTMSDLREREPENPPLRDRLAEPGVRTLSDHWRTVFTLPRHGPDGLDETVYFLDYQGARIVSLNSNEQQDVQVAWLRRVLADNPQRWTIVTFHHPIFSPARGRDNPQLRALWKPVLDEFKVDLVLTGHDHTYARSGDVRGIARVGSANVATGYQQVYDPAIGTVYVVSVSGPKMYDLTNDAWAVRTAEDTQLFQVITVDGDALRYEARTATGRLYDAFTLRKRAGEANELIEALPRENRRGVAAP